MLTRSPSNVHLWTAIAVSTGLALGMTSCSEGESRNAPSDQETSASEAAAEPAAPTPALQAGTTMRFTVGETVSTDTHAVGDYFTAGLIAPVTDGAGNVLLDAGTQSRWVVTESTVADGQAVLAVELDGIRVSGNWTDVEATVLNADVDTDDPDSDGETAAKIGVGTAAGAIIGQILGEDTRSTLTGAGVGAAVGTAVALSTRGGSARLPAQSSITVELNEPLTVP